MSFSLIRRASAAIAGAAAITLIGATAASAHHCVNISKQNQAAGVQLVIDVTTEEGEIVWMSKGLEQRIASGVVDPNTGEGFYGLLGLDFDGDGVADVSTYSVGGQNHGSLPGVAMENGGECHGIIEMGAFFECSGF